MSSQKLLKPFALPQNSTIGVFTPSTPAHVLFREKYLHGVKNLKKLGFTVKEGSLTTSLRHQGYRTATAQERAAEFMELIEDPNVHALISTIGGYNSASLIPFLDFQKIRESRKIICGYSDVTSLHLAILKHAQLSTFYGPAVMPSFGEYPDVLEETKTSFLSACQQTQGFPNTLEAPERWSNHFRDALTDEWKTVEREFHPNPGWLTLHPGKVTAPLLCANLNTLCSNAGTKHFPDLSGRILMIETMSGSMGSEERLLRHLQLLGVFDQISGLIVGKYENLNTGDSSLTPNDLLLEIIGKPSFPIVTGFDCCHTVPMITLAQECLITLSAAEGALAKITLEEPLVAAR